MFVGEGKAGKPRISLRILLVPHVGSTISASSGGHARESDGAGALQTYDFLIFEQMKSMKNEMLGEWMFTCL